MHADFINICSANCDSWAQVGTFQGYPPQGTASYGAVHVYYENNVCGGDEYFGDVGAAPTPDYPYYVTWDGNGSFHDTCRNGDPFVAYNWLWRKGSVTNTPFYNGELGITSGQALAETEIHDSATIGTDYYGCDANKGCSDGGYGLHLYNGSSWSSLTSAAPVTPGQPPFAHLFHQYWAFATCPVAC